MKPKLHLKTKRKDSKNAANIRKTLLVLFYIILIQILNIILILISIEQEKNTKIYS
jgi:hypothetical protein